MTNLVLLSVVFNVLGFFAGDNPLIRIGKLSPPENLNCNGYEELGRRHAPTEYSRHEFQLKRLGKFVCVERWLTKRETNNETKIEPPFEKLVYCRNQNGLFVASQTQPNGAFKLNTTIVNGGESAAPANQIC